jgi:hypothetical protein
MARGHGARGAESLRDLVSLDAIGKVASLASRSSLLRPSRRSLQEVECCVSTSLSLGAPKCSPQREGGFKEDFVKKYQQVLESCRERSIPRGKDEEEKDEMQERPRPVILKKFIFAVSCGCTQRPFCHGSGLLTPPTVIFHFGGDKSFPLWIWRPPGDGIVVEAG